MDTSKHITVGDITCIAVTDQLSADASDFVFQDIDVDLLATLKADGIYPEGPVPASQTCLLVEGADGWLLMDSGVNNDDSHLLENIAAAGVQREDIKHIILTHCHGDHYLGLTDADGTPRFPGVPIYIWHSEYAHMVADAALERIEQSDAESAQFLRLRLLPLRDQMVQIDENNAEIVPGVHMIPLIGHTPGHCGVQVSSNGHHLLHGSDAIPHPLFARRPDVPFVFDNDNALTAAARRAFCEKAIELNATCLLYHFAFPSMGTFAHADDGLGYTWHAQ